MHQSRVVSLTKGAASPLQSFRSRSPSSNRGSWVSLRRLELIDGAFPSGNALFVLLTCVATWSHYHSLLMENTSCQHIQVLQVRLWGGGGVLGKGLGKTQIPFRAPGNRRQTKKPHLLQRHSGLLKICSKLVFYTRKWSCTPCRAALENIAWFWSSMAGLRITVITRLLGFFIQMLPFPGLHGKTWPEELGVLAEDMEVHMDSWDVCSPQQRSN